VPCEVNHCRSGGRCVPNEYSPYGFNCLCVPDYYGLLCNDIIDDCSYPEQISCSSNGICNDGNQTFTCSCFSGFNGSFCEIDIAPCDPSPCENNATCADLGPDQYECICMDGFSGDNCEYDDDFCNATFCENGGTCYEDVGPATTCSCTEGFTGDVCEIDIDNYCTISLCANNGTCIEGIGTSVSCSCLSRYTGKFCEVDICDYVVCYNRGICTRNVGPGVHCQCSEGYSGINCEKTIGNDTIENLLNCEKSIENNTIENSLDVCALTNCLNGGTCTYADGSFICICSQYWSGHVCQDCTIPSCGQCIFDVVLNTTSCLKCLSGYFLTSSGNCGKY